MMSAVVEQPKVKEHPILFSAPMVRAILAGRKTQTRRASKPQPDEEINGEPYWHVGGFRLRETAANPLLCPYGRVGEHLWVRETFWAIHGGQFLHDSKEQREETERVNCKGYGIQYVADNPELSPDYWTKKPAIFMPRWASRITLEITAIRVERLQNINLDDIYAEGFENPHYRRGSVGGDFSVRNVMFPEGWDKINGKRKGCSWNDNPFVWVISFKKI
jgi:hypothetical protein